MENLILIRQDTFKLLDEFSNSSIVFDGNAKIAFIVCENQIYSFGLNDKKFNRCASFQPKNVKAKVIYSCYIIEDELLFVLFSNGEIITYDSVNDMILKHLIDIQGTINDAKFSHDQELLAITTTDNQMLLYNKLLVLKREYNLNKKEFGVNVMVNVNWGSKSTQFHGQGMRDHRSVREETVSLLEWDDHSNLIEWKHDDYSFVINTVMEEGYRLLKIFNREGILQYTSEYVPGLAKPISWKPTGNLIAASRQTSDVLEIIFFENNGLQHGQFKLPYKPRTFIIEKISWSYDSNVLLVCGFKIQFVDKDNGDQNYRRMHQDVMLFTQNNYHWYLKQRIKFDESNFIENIVWDENEYLMLHFLSSNGSYLNYLYNSIRQVTEKCNALLIDGDQLNISDFLNTLVPPPMFTYSIRFRSLSESLQIKQVVHREDRLAIILDDDSMMILKLVDSTLETLNKIHDKISYDFVNIGATFLQVYLPIFFERIAKISDVLHANFDKNFNLFGCIDQTIVRLDSRNDYNIVSHGKLVYNCDTMLLMPDDQTFLISNSNRFDHCDLNGSIIPDSRIASNNYDGNCSKASIFIDSEGQTHLIVLTRNYSLYYDENCLFKSNVNSFLIYRNDYLLITTIDSKFHCWSLKNFDPIKSRQNHPPRNLEKGSKLLTVSYENAKVVVELPRGNLEAFYPRILLLDNVNELIRKKQFVEAFEILRTNRINLNYICDFDFEWFLENIEEFIQQLASKNFDWICLFLYELSSSNHYHILNHQTEVKIADKLDIICDRFISTMDSNDLDRKNQYLKPIVLCYVKKQKPEIVEALNRIKEIDDSQLKDSVVEFLVKITNIDRLLEEALGTYDFDLLLMVASRSNKDPKEYNALIEGFKRTVDPNYRKFQIDFHLRRYKKCLLHLSKCPDRLVEALDLIQSKHLYKEAIKIFDLNKKSNDERFKQIWELYAEYLFKKCYYREAAIAYKRASNYSQAYKMYVQCCDWNEACVCARKICQESEEDFRKMIKILAQNLQMNRNYISAAHINEHYLNNYNESFRILIQGHHWEFAIRLHNDYNLEKSLLENDLNQEIMNSFEQISNECATSVSNISDHVNRLKELQEINRNISDGKFDADNDVYSDTSSLCDTASLKSFRSDTSTDTLKTNRSSHSRQKHLQRKQQKKYLLKRGSLNEDIQIIYAIKDIILKSFELFKDSYRLVQILYDLYLVEQSSSLQSSLDSLAEQINDSIQFIWDSGLFASRLEDDELLRTAPNKIDSHLFQWRMALN